jgi:Domain of unknown function (DUF4252)
VKLTYCLAALVAATTLSIATPAPAAGPQLQIPDFSHLRGKAADSTDITLDGFLLRIAKKFAAEDRSGDEALSILSDIKSLRVKNFEFDSDGEYSRADVDAVRKQLAGPGWSALAQVHRRDPQEDVDVFVNIDGDKILGIAVVASEPRSFTIVNIVGSIDIDKLAKIEGQFGIPRVGADELREAE